MLYPAELRGRAETPRPAAPLATADVNHASWQVPRIRPEDAAAAGRDARRAIRYLDALEQKSVKVPPMSPVESDEEDLTRKQRREQARAQRKAMEEAEAASAVRRTRLTQLGIVVAVVVVAIVVVLVATGGGSGTKTGLHRRGKHERTRSSTQVTALVGGIPQSGNVAGQPDGAGDAAVLRRPGVPDLPGVHARRAAHDHPEWVRTGKLKIEYRSLETATREPEVFKTQQVAALAAGKQNKVWNFIETFYHEQGEEDSGYVTEKYLQGIASQVPGLNLTQWTSDRSNRHSPTRSPTDAQAASNAGFTGTPSFLIGKTGGAMNKLEYSTRRPTRVRQRSRRKAAEGLERDERADA